MSEPATPEDYLGLPAAEAVALATERGWQTRPLRPGDAMTMDYRTDRLNLYLDEDDAVVKVTVG